MIKRRRQNFNYITAFSILGISMLASLNTLAQVSDAQNISKAKGKSPLEGTTDGKFQEEGEIYCFGNYLVNRIRLLRFRQENGDGDYYGFQLICTNGQDFVKSLPRIPSKGKWTGEFNDLPCPRGQLVNGLYFERWRKGKGDKDSYRFQILCNAGGYSDLVGRRLDRLISQHTVLCPGNEIANGFYLQRWRKGDGDVDTYKFMVLCN